MSTSVAPEKTHQTAIDAEADFVSQFAGKLEKGEAGVDRGRVKAEREQKESAADEGSPAKPAVAEKEKSTAAPKAGTVVEGTPSKEAAPSGGSEAAPAGDDAKGDAPENGDKKPADDKKPEGDADEVAADADEKGKEKEEEPVDIEDLDDSELAQEAKAQLEKHGLKMTLDDLPKEARPLVQKVLDGMKAGYTRAMMEQRAYRKEETQFQAARAYSQEHPEMFIFDLLHSGKDGELNEEVFARHDDGGGWDGQRPEIAGDHHQRHESRNAPEDRGATKRGRGSQSPRG